MKKFTAIIILAVMCIALLTSCSAPNTVSSDIAFNYTMVGDLKTVDDQTIAGAVWRAIIDKSRKYYPLQKIELKEGEVYSEIYKKAAAAQIALAASIKKDEVKYMVLTSESYISAFMDTSVQDLLNKNSVVSLLFAVQSSELSTETKLAELNASRKEVKAKTTVILFDAVAYGEQFSYTAAKLGKKSIGFIGTEGAVFTDFAEGLAKGAEKAKNEGLEITVKTKKTTSGNTKSVLDTDIVEIKDCEIIVGDEITMDYVAENFKGKYASIYNDKDAVFSVYPDFDLLTGVVKKILSDAKSIESPTRVLKYSDLTEGKPVFINSESVTVPADTEADTTVADAGEDTAVDTAAVTAAEESVSAESTADPAESGAETAETTGE